MGSRALKVLCPTCRKAMKPSQQKPVLFTHDIFEVTFTCKKCGTAETRTVSQDEKPPPVS
jgi:C4-type Zn-finger protein